jgi:hypothetical protein
MATAKQKTAARKNLVKARAAQSVRATGTKRTTKKTAKKTSPKKPATKKSSVLSTARQNRLPAKDFAFTRERKEPLTDARHVRNAIARFDQVEDVTDAERDRAWKKIRAAAKKFDVEVTAESWRELFRGGKAKKAKKR